MTGPGKTGLICTSTRFHYLSVRKSYTHALPKNTKNLTMHRWPGLLSQMVFTDGFYRCCKTTRMHFFALRGINRTAWGTNLLLTAVLAHPVDCISSSPILKAQHCCLSPNSCLRMVVPISTVVGLLIPCSRNILGL